MNWPTRPRQPAFWPRRSSRSPSRAARATRWSTKTRRSAPKSPPRASPKLRAIGGDDATHTAGNAPGVNDGAGALVLASEEWAEANGKESPGHDRRLRPDRRRVRLPRQDPGPGRKGRARQARQDPGRRRPLGSQRSFRFGLPEHDQDARHRRRQGERQRRRRRPRSSDRRLRRPGHRCARPRAEAPRRRPRLRRDLLRRRSGRRHPRRGLSRARRSVGSAYRHETERKFLVDRIPEGLTGPEGVPIEQGYLAIDEQSEVRLRRAGETLTLTVKHGHGESRDETEVEVDQATFDDLWPESEDGGSRRSAGRSISRTGWWLNLTSTRGELEGLSVVEVEFESDGAGRRFPSAGLVRKGTDRDRAWANQELAVNGQPEKRLEYRIRPGEDPGEAICRVITARASQAAAAVRRAGEADDSARDVHEARKSLKKVRSALRLLQGSDSRRRAQGGERHLPGFIGGTRRGPRRRGEAGHARLGDRRRTRIRRARGTGGQDWKRKLPAIGATSRHEGLAGVAEEIETMARNFRGRRTGCRKRGDRRERRARLQTGSQVDEEGQKRR